MMKILVVFGTRPEAIKMAPLVMAFNKHSHVFTTKVCVTAQHREMLDQVLKFFSIHPDYDLDLMKKNQNLFSLTSDLLAGMKQVLEEYKPDYVFVHGDTTTSFVASLAAFYAGAKVCHVEAGLRTYNKWAPFPEEMNRQLTARLSDYHYAPTQVAGDNLLKEGISSKAIQVTGNTVIDALLYAVKKLDEYRDQEIDSLIETLDFNKRIVLVTGHRRENFGDGIRQICQSLLDIVTRFPDVEIVYPVHLNPNVQDPVNHYLSGVAGVKLIQPLGYPAFVWLMGKAHIILTDSGGIQEEAPSLGKPVLVMRETTERPEALEAGTIKLVGADYQRILSEVSALLTDDELYQQMVNAANPYGDGKAAQYIVEHLLNSIN